MPSRKQRRKRDKERRHEYELVLVDEEGEERPIDSAELRAQRREKEEAAAKGKGKSGAKAQPARGKGSARPIREVKPPTWNRVLKRAGLFAAFMFLVLTFVPNLAGGQKHSMASVLVPTVLYTILFAPLLFLIDRVQYKQYLRKIGQEPAAPSREPRSKAESKPGDDGATGLSATLRKAFRR